MYFTKSYNGIRRKFPRQGSETFGFLSSLGTIPLGKLDFFIKVALEPESSKTRNNFLLHTKFIVLTVQIVGGHSLDKDCTSTAFLLGLSKFIWYKSISEFDNSESQNDNAQSTEGILIVIKLTKVEDEFLISFSLLHLVLFLFLRAE